MKRTTGMILRLTPEEKQALTEKADRTYLSREEFCRQVLKDVKVYERPDALFYDLIAELKEVGSMLDQIIKSLEDTDLEVDLKALNSALERNWNTEKMLWDTFRPQDH